MELIYLYIRKYENIFENVDFNFSSNFFAKIENNQLLVEYNQKAIKKYYGENVNSVVMFLGQNGTGKSTLLDILGMNRDDRSSETYIHRNGEYHVKHSYFILYHLYKDYFAFEFVDESFLEGDGKLKNVDMQSENVQGALYKVPIVNDKDTFATNIYYLLMDSFMLENTFGEYSYKQLDKILKLLKGSNVIDLEQMEWIGKIIDRIGEKTVKKKLLYLYKEHNNLKEELVEKLSSETDQTKLM